MKCTTVAQLLSAYIDRELRREDLREIDAHLGSCEPCMKQSRLDLRLKKELFAAHRDIRAPETLRENLQEQLGVVDMEVFPPRASWRSLAYFRPSVVALAASVLLVILIGFPVYYSVTEKAVVEGHLMGRLICLSCSVGESHSALENHRGGFLSDDGRIWSFVASDFPDRLLRPHRSGTLQKAVQIDGTFHREHSLIEVDCYTFLDSPSKI